MEVTSDRWSLVGRGVELALLDDHVGGRGASMVVRGAAGVGKSRLLADWLAGPAAADRPTVVIRATRSTATIPFGAFARWVPGAAGVRRDRLDLLQATTDRILDLGPGLVVAVDDAQFLDEGSAALVLHLAQDPSARVVVTVRTGEPCPDAIVALWKESIAERLDLQPLSQSQTVELLERTLGDVGLSTRRRLWRLSQGNPLYLREVVDAGRDQGTLKAVAGTWRWEGTLAGGTRLVELVRDRVGARDPATRRALELVALGEPLPVEVLARLVPSAVLVELEAQGLVATERPGPREGDVMVRLDHPLYSEVLRAELPVFTARTLHHDLAEAAMATALHHRDPLRVATWLLAGGDEVADAELLLRASRLASLVDDHELSAELAEAAERAGGGWQATVRRAEALGPLRRWDEVATLLSTLAAAGSPPEARAAAARLRAENSFFHRGEDLAAARAAVAEAVEHAPASARSAVLMVAATLAVMALELDEAVRLATAAASDAETVTDRLNGIACAGLAAGHLGRTREALAIVELASPHALNAINTDPVAAGFLAYTYSDVAVIDGRIDEAVAIFDLLRDIDLLVHMDGPTRALPAFWSGRAALAQGRVTTATRLCQDALAILRDTYFVESGIVVAATLATAAAQAGDAETATGAVAWMEADNRPVSGTDALFARLARAWLTASRGELSSARRTALDVADRADRAGARLIEMLALHDLTRLGAPLVAAPRLEELAHAIDGPYPAAAAHHARAAAERHGAGLDAAAARFAAIGARLLAAEAAATAAEVHAEAGRRRDHAASLATAQSLAAECEGAVTPLLARLDHTPVVATLTERELEVAHLAARGRTNREIAQVLTVSVRTVDSHLDHAYTKLGINRRDDLVRALGNATSG